MDGFLLWLVVGTTLTSASIYFGAATFAFRDLSRVKLSKILEQRGWADRLDSMVDRTTELMMVSATLRLLANIGLILVTTALFEGHIHNVMVHYATVLGVAGGLILVFGLAIPNAWAKYAGEELIVYTYPVLALSGVLLKPVTYVLRATDEVIRRLAGAPRPDDADEAEAHEQEILDIVSEGEKHGAVDETEKEMIESVIELRDTHAAQIMTPRTEVLGMDVRSSVDDIRELIVREGHSRIPIYEETIDKVVGVLYAKDLLKIADQGRPDLRSLMRDVPFVPESKPLRDLLKEFQETKIHLAIVIDEYGGTAGLVTMEDILEELVGEIVDEYEPPEPEPLTLVDESTVEIEAKLRIDELNDELEIELPEGKDYDTVGGFVLAELGRIPSPEEELTIGNVNIHILEADARKIRRIRVTVDRSQPAEKNDDAD